MKKILFALIAIIMSLSILTGCAAKGDDGNKSTLTTTESKNGGEKDPDNSFENKTVFKTENFEIDSKTTKYLYAYILNVYYQYYGQYASYYVTAEVVENQAKEMLVYCEAAKAAGFELTSDDLTEISESVAAHERSLKENGFDTIADYYGDGVDAEAIIEATKLQILSQKFNSHVTQGFYDSLSADKEALEKYYDEHKELVFGTCFKVAVNDEAYYSRLCSVATKDELKAIANEYCTEKNISSDNVMGEQASYYPELKEGESLSAFDAWFFDGNRVKGDIYADDNTKTVYCVTLPGKKYSELLKNAGHILIIPKGNTEEDKTDARVKAEAILAEYLAGAQTKEAFEALGKENTEDGNVFYDNIYLGQMVEPFSDWVYDGSRKIGDTGIVETDYGYHVMYFVGDGELKNYEYFALSELYQTKIEEFDAEIKAQYSVTVDKDTLSDALGK